MKTRSTRSLFRRAWLMLLLVSCAAACSTGVDGGPPDTGSVSVAVVGIPSGVLCVSLTVGDAGGTFDVTTPGPTVFDVGAVTSGNTSASGFAYNVACSSLTDTTEPTWVADPTPIMVRTGNPVNLTLVFRRNQPGRVTTDFRENAVQIAAGAESSYAVLADGTVRAWGNNFSGQLGDGTFVDRPTPTTIPGLTNVKSIAAGDGHACALRGDGTVLCWGNNAFGSVGDGSTTMYRPSPTAVSGLSGVVVVQIAAGASTSCALLANGALRCWGRNVGGQIGDGTTIDRNVATNVAGSDRFIDVSVGGSHTCAVAQSGALVFCWGFNGFGQLGIGTTSNRLLPTSVPGGHGNRRVRAGRAHTCAERSDGALRCWGVNTFGYLGDGTTIPRYAPVATGLINAEGASLGSRHTCTRLDNGLVACWGQGSFGALGDGSGLDRLSPTRVPKLSGVAEVAAGGFHTCARLESGAVLCWGMNRSGEIGDGTRADRFVPTPVVL